MRSSLVRNSKSEDQLSYDELNINESDEDKLNSSCHTLLDSAHTPARPGHSIAKHNTNTGPPHVSSESSSSRSTGSKGSSADQLLSSQVLLGSQHAYLSDSIFQPSDEATSPDFSTSSLISCSEHYNGESLLDNMSPQSPSSPDTPEWSLIANGESFHKVCTIITEKASILLYLNVEYESSKVLYILHQVQKTPCILVKSFIRIVLFLTTAFL